LCVVLERQNACTSQPGTVANGLQDILALEVGKVVQNFFDALAGSQGIKNHSDSDTHTAYGWASSHQTGNLSDSINADRSIHFGPILDFTPHRAPTHSSPASPWTTRSRPQTVPHPSDHTRAPGSSMSA